MPSDCLLRLASYHFGFLFKAAPDDLCHKTCLQRTIHETNRGLQDTGKAHHIKGQDTGTWLARHAPPRPQQETGTTPEPA
jgi:hypothetical protein